MDGRPCVHPDHVTANPRKACYLHGLFNHYFSSREIVEWAARQPRSKGFCSRATSTTPGRRVSSYWLAPAAQTTSEMPTNRARARMFSTSEPRSVPGSSALPPAQRSAHPSARLRAKTSTRLISCRSAARRPSFVDGGPIPAIHQGLLAHGVGVWIAFGLDLRSLEGAARRQRTDFPVGDRPSTSCLAPRTVGSQRRVGFADNRARPRMSSENPGPDFQGRPSRSPSRRRDRPLRADHVKLDIEGRGAGGAARNGKTCSAGQRILPSASITGRPISGKSR